MAQPSNNPKNYVLGWPDRDFVIIYYIGMVSKFINNWTHLIYINKNLNI